MRFCAYLVLSSLSAIGFRDRRIGLMAGLSMFFLGVTCGVLLASPIRTLIAIR
jgi:hypothetical protein